jgi:phosphate transport system permease protein
MSTMVQSFKPRRSALDTRRQVSNLLVIVLTTLCLIFTIGMLVYLTAIIFAQGFRYLNLNFFTQLPTANGEPGGGMGQSFQGTLILVALASLFGIPLGIFTAIYLSEYGRGPLASTVRFVVDVLTGIPTIIFGLFAWTLLVIPGHSFSGFSGSVALAIIMIPIVTRTTEEVLRLVPRELREASLALGATQSRTILRVVLPAASRGIITGILLAMARIAGETAPLLMTAFGTTFWNNDITLPMDALPLRVFAFAGSAFQEQVNQAYAGAFLLILLILLTSFTVRWVTGGFQEAKR